MMHYLDNAATTPVRPEAIQAAVEAMSEGWGNPSARYALGSEAAVAQLNAVAQSGQHVSIIFLHRELDDIVVVGGVALRVKIAYRQIGNNSVSHEGVKATVGRNDIVVGTGVRAQGEGEGHRAHYITDSFVIHHRNTPPDRTDQPAAQKDA